MPSRRQDTQPFTDGAAVTPQAAHNKLRLLYLPASGQEGLLLCTGNRKDRARKDSNSPQVWLVCKFM